MGKILTGAGKRVSRAGGGRRGRAGGDWGPEADGPGRVERRVALVARPVRR